MKIQRHNINKYSKEDSSFGNLLSQYAPKEEPKPELQPEKEVKAKLELPDSECLLNGNKVSSANRSGSSMGSTGWGHSSLDEMLKRLDKK